MNNMLNRPYAIHLNSLNNGLCYTKRKYLDEAQNEFVENFYSSKIEKINCWKYQGIENNQFITYDSSKLNFNNQLNKKAYANNNNNNKNHQENVKLAQKNQRLNQHNNSNKKAEFSQFDTRVFSSNNNDNRNMPAKHRFIEHKFNNHSPNNRVIVIEDQPPRTKLKKHNSEFASNHNMDQKLVKKSMIDLSQQNNNNNTKLNRKFPTFNNGSMLNSLADYNLNNLDDKMYNLNIDYSRNDIKNMSLDSLTNIRFKLNKNTIPRDEFAAYRLTENDPTILDLETLNPIKNKFSTLSSYNCCKLADFDGNIKPTEPVLNSNNNNTNTVTPHPKKNRHHHHRAKRNNKNKKAELKKSQNSIHDMQNDNQDSLSAFDFSNTDEFWEDDIVINSELIEQENIESFQDEIETPLIKFVSVSCEGLNGLLMDNDKFDLKESIIKDKLYEDILDFKDNLTIN